MKKILALVLGVMLALPLLPVMADWLSADGTGANKGQLVCKDSQSGVEVPTGYVSKSYNSAICSGYNKLVAFMSTGTAQAQQAFNMIVSHVLPNGIVVAPPPAGPSLSPPWVRTEIGGAMAGNAFNVSNVLTQTCYGALGSTSDTGATVNQSLTGDLDVVAQVQNMVGNSSNAVAGIRISDSNAAGAMYVMVSRGNFSGTPNASFAYRSATNGAFAYVGAVEVPLNTWFRLTRQGNNYSGYWGTTSFGPWNSMGTVSIAMSGSDLVGTMCTNGNDAQAATMTMTLPTISVPGGSNGAAAFTSATQSINENVTPLVITVARSGGSTGATSVNVQRDGTSNASPGTDYNDPGFPVTLNWANGDVANKTINVTILNRAGSQASRHLDVSLTGAAGGMTIGSPSAQVNTILDVSSGAQVRSRFGWYGDCYIETPYGGDHRLALNNVEWNALKSCIDFFSTQTNVRGVFVGSTWTSWEGSTKGCYDASCSNDLGGPGTIGYPLLDALLAYVASKNTHLILGFDWFQAGYGACGETYNTGGNLNLGGPAVMYPRYIVQSSCTPGTDASNTYGVTLMPAEVGGYIAPRLWKAAAMTAYMDMVAAMVAHADNNNALEAIVLMPQEGDCSGCVGLDGYDPNALKTQIERIPAYVKPSAPHTHVLVANAWTNVPNNLLANAGTTNPIGTFNNDWVVPNVSAGQAQYMGITSGVPGNDPNWGNTSTHSYVNEAPEMIWRAPTEYCDSRIDGVHVTQDFYNVSFVTGRTDSAGFLDKPRWAIVGRWGDGACPSMSNQVWGTISSGGQYQQIQSLTLNTTCPTNYTAGCNTTP